MRPLLLLLAVTAFGQSGSAITTLEGSTYRYCYATHFGPYQDQCTGELLPLSPLRSARVEWLWPAEMYNERVIRELSLRILALETKVALLQAVASGEIRAEIDGRAK